MNEPKGFCGKTGLLAAGVMLATLVVAPCAYATQVHIGFSGVAGSGNANLTIESDIGNGDPAGAMAITGASGMFGSATITGVQPLNHAGAMFPTESLPGSFSFLVPPGTSYDNLYYAGGSPVVCLNVNLDGTTSVAYPFSGGFLDIYGVMFTLNDGNLLGLWSNGITPGGLTYGMSLLTSLGNGGYSISSSGLATATVPEPGLMWLFGAGVLGLFGWRRSLEKRTRKPCVD
ncbi:MAG: PEP-CTERM sorting domain-containing protein [Rhodanobacter sp.]